METVDICLFITIIMHNYLNHDDVPVQARVHDYKCNCVAVALIRKIVGSSIIVYLERENELLGAIQIINEIIMISIPCCGANP